MSFKTTKATDLKLVHSISADKPRVGFPIEITGNKETVFDKQLGAYEGWVVGANGFCIAYFVDETSMHSYIKYLQDFGFKQFPKKIMEIIESLAKK